jgi:hypothetical protein
VSRLPPIVVLQDAFRALFWIPITVLALTLAGCGANIGGYEPTFPPTLGFAQWDPISADSCWGQLTTWVTQQRMSGCTCGMPPLQGRRYASYTKISGSPCRRR